MKTSTAFDPITQGRQSCGLMRADKLLVAFKGQVVNAHSRAVKARMTEPVVIVFDLADSFGIRMAESVFGIHAVDDHLGQINGGVRHGVRFASITARPCEAVRRWLLDEGESDAARELSPSSYPGNVVALVAACGDIHQFNADRC